MDESILQAMQVMGATPEDIDLARQQQSQSPPPQAPAVYAENSEAVAAFIACRTQWQYAGMAGKPTGLCYAGTTAWIDRNIPRRRRRKVFSDIQVMEHACMVAFAELQAQENPEK